MCLPIRRQVTRVLRRLSRAEGAEVLLSMQLLLAEASLRNVFHIVAITSIVGYCVHSNGRGALVWIHLIGWGAAVEVLVPRR